MTRLQFLILSQFLWGVSGSLREEAQCWLSETSMLHCAHRTFPAQERNESVVPSTVQTVFVIQVACVHSASVPLSALQSQKNSAQLVSKIMFHAKDRLA